jgi:hypothetical protein
MLEIWDVPVGDVRPVVVPVGDVRPVVVPIGIATTIGIVGEIAIISSHIPMLTNWALVFEAHTVVTFVESFTVGVVWQVDRLARVLVEWTTLVWSTIRSDSRRSCS